MPRFWPQRGFTLIEVLVTLVILSTGIVLVLRAFGTSLVALTAARDVLTASDVLRVPLAQAEVLAAAGDTAGLLALGGPVSGEGGFRGSVDVTPVSLGSVGAAPDTPLRLYRVDVSVWREGGDGSVTSASTLLHAADERPDEPAEDA